MKLSVIIVNYNVRYFLEQCLVSVLRATERLEAEVFVVDNNSSDASVEMVRSRFPTVHLIANTDNPGFSKANNQALEQARGEYVLLLNPDTIVGEACFEDCVRFMDAHPNAAGLGARMIDGSGTFLPESKRGFPTPWVAFAKSFGLARLFPRSRLFNRYHLGFLSEHHTQEVEVLAGAFMWMRRSALEQVGWLDEAFFMYGEDIDLSYRLVQAGFENYYFPQATIIHYKGESTKKGSLNYVRTFYQAMIIFARKHFQGRGATFFIGILQLAIYFRAGMSLLRTLVRRVALPLLDAGLIYGGLVVLKNFWANYHFQDPDYYPDDILYLNFPLYCLLWIGGIYLSGGYYRPLSSRRALRGLILSTLLLTALYGLLPETYRASRALLILGFGWALATTLCTRWILHYLAFGRKTLDRSYERRLMLVGSSGEEERALRLLRRAEVRFNYLGRVGPGKGQSLGSESDLPELIGIYRAEELIFCARDLSFTQIIEWMQQLGQRFQFRILPPASDSIIGSPSKNEAGDLYTLDIRYALQTELKRREKRLLDVALVLLLFLTWPLQVFFVRRPLGIWRNAWAVLTGQLSWVGYAPVDNPSSSLPAIRSGLFSPADRLLSIELDETTLHRLNYFYAKDYSVLSDLEIIIKKWSSLGK